MMRVDRVKDSGYTMRGRPFRWNPAVLVSLSPLKTWWQGKLRQLRGGLFLLSIELHQMRKQMPGFQRLSLAMDLVNTPPFP